MGNINYEEIDEPMRAIVKLLNDNNFKTSASCQGGEGHAFSLPTLVFEDGYNEEKLLNFLLEVSLSGFTINRSRQYQNKPNPFKEYLTLEFWNLDCIGDIKSES